MRRLDLHMRDGELFETALDALYERPIQLTTLSYHLSKKTGATYL